MPLFRSALLAALAAGVVLAAPDEPKKPVPKFKLGKDTTFVDGPLDKDGYIDYEAAVNERLKGKITPETNAVVLLMKCLGPKPEGTELPADFYKTLGIEPPPEKGDYLVGSDKHFAEELKAEDQRAFHDLETRLKQRPWKPEDSLKHAEWLEVNEKPLALAVEASGRTDYFHPITSRRGDNNRGVMAEAWLGTFRHREIAALFALRVTHTLSKGNIDDAFADVLTMHRLGRLVSRGGFLIDDIFGILFQLNAHSSELAIFEHGRPTAKQSLAYQSELMKLPPIHAVADKIQFGERLFGLDAIQNCERLGFDIFNYGTGKNEEEIRELGKKLEFGVLLRSTNAWCDKIVLAMRLSKRPARSAAIDKLMSELEKSNAIVTDRTSLASVLREVEAFEKLPAKVSERVAQVSVGQSVQSFVKLADAADRAEQIHRNGLLAAGLAAHFADHKKYPDKLDDLAPKYIAVVPGDAFNEKPLVYKKTDTGYLLYSVGVNGKDNGGQLISDEPRGDDIGVRMPRK